jgi:hypothetical protein
MQRFGPELMPFATAVGTACWESWSASSGQTQTCAIQHDRRASGAPWFAPDSALEEGGFELSVPRRENLESQSSQRSS